MIYLDYNATAPLMPHALAAMQEAYALPHNASSVHVAGRLAKQRLETARKSIAETINAFPNEIIFTGSGTEANALALNGFADRLPLVSAVEHPSVLSARSDAKIIPVDAQGIVRLAALEDLLKNTGQGKALVSVMLANNETGVIQPIAEIAALAHRYGALMHSDAAQAVGRISVDMQALGVDMLSFCGHKCGGPIGAGVLAVRQDMAIEPLLKGGRQELGRRAGTENIPAIMGLVAALNATPNNDWRDWLNVMEAAILASGGVVFGQDTPRLPNTSCIAMPGVAAETQVMAFDLSGFAVSAGSACSSGKVTTSHVLNAMHVTPDLAACAIRISIGWDTKKEEVERFTEAWISYFHKRQKKVA